MSLKKLEQEVATLDIANMSGIDVLAFISQYVADEKKSYESNKAARNITWGKYKGNSVSQVANMEKGKSYLEWTLSQTWMTEDKFSWFYDECKKIGISKK